MHAVPFYSFQQVNVLKNIGAGRKRIQRRGQHGDIALDVLYPAFPKWRAGGEKDVRHGFDGCQRAPARHGIGQIGGDMRERRLA
jgi:hypothetical protein